METQTIRPAEVCGWSGGREGLRMRPRWWALAPGETVGPSTEIEDEQ